MQPYPVLSPTTVDGVSRQLAHAAAGLGDAAARETDQLVVRLAPDLWPLEWHLPFWLGRDFGLGEAVWQQLVRVNLLGAGHVRLADDLADEALDPAQRAAKAALGQRFMDLATGLLLTLFEESSPFWRKYETYLDQWRLADEAVTGWSAAASAQLADGWQRLAWRGAPAKITATGVCLLAGRDAAIAPLETCIDHVMAATVLMDHADDWPEDLVAGRFNVYVAWISNLPQRRDQVSGSRQQILAALMQGDGAGHLSYYRLIDRHLAAAQQVAGPVASAGLAAYIGAFRQSAQEHGASQLAAARQAFQEALASLLVGFDDR